MLPWPRVDFSKFGEIEEVELGRIQKISGANLSRNWVMIPHVTHFDKTDITDLEAFRKQQNAEAEKRKLDVKFTPVVFIMKAVAAALERMPRFNSSLSEDGQKLTLKKYINIGVAVDTPNGLVVPVFQRREQEERHRAVRELTTISKKARDGNDCRRKQGRLLRHLQHRRPGYHPLRADCERAGSGYRCVQVRDGAGVEWQRVRAASDDANLSVLRPPRDRQG